MNSFNMRLSRGVSWKYCFLDNNKWFGYCYNFEYGEMTINMYFNGDYEYWHGTKNFYI